MKIFVFGWYSHGNIGDESYRLSFKEVWLSHDFYFSDTIQEQDFSRFDLCIVGGGDVVRQESLSVISKFNCPKIALSVTITQQSLCKEINSFDYIYVRDQKSLQILSDFGYSRTSYLPDISIVLEGDKQNGKELINNLFEKNKCDLYSKVYSITINSHLLGNSTSRMKDKIIFDKMVNDISELIDSTPASFLFIPFSTQFPWDDRVTNGLTNSFTKFYQKNCVIFNPLSVQDSIDIISSSDLLITSRFHGLVFGIGNEVPTVTLSFHDKISGFCKTIEQPYIDYYNLNLGSLQDQIKNISVNTKINKQQVKDNYIEKVHLLQR